MKTKNESRKRFDLMCIKLLHLGISVLLFYVFWLLYRFGRLTDLPHYGFRYNYYVAFGYGVVMFFFLRTYNGYLLGYTRIRALIFAQGLSQFFSTAIMWFIVSLAWKHWDAPWIFFGMLFLQLVLDTVWSYFANGLYFRLYPVKRTILIYRNELDKKRFGTLRGKPSERLYRIDEEFRYGTDYISVMPTNLYGPNDNYHPTHSHVLPALIRRFHEAKVEGKESVTCWGDGSPLREFMYVEDLANLCVFLMNNYSGNETVNAGTGKELTIKELTELVAKVVGYTGKIEWDTTKPNGTPRKLLDVSKATALGWTYKTELEDGIRLSYEDFLHNPMRAER